MTVDVKRFQILQGGNSQALKTPQNPHALQAKDYFEDYPRAPGLRQFGIWYTLAILFLYHVQMYESGKNQAPFLPDSGINWLKDDYDMNLRRDK
jgi:hypothetical protein